MALSQFDTDGKQRLEEVIKIAGTNLNLVPYAVSQVLKGECERGRRIYLRNQLTKIAKRRIRDALKKNKQRPKLEGAPFTITPAGVLDAWRHEQALLRYIPEDDR